jgi:tetratricopeptide (TPR) repeat protein
LTAAGRFEEAEREMRRAQQLEPLSLIASAALGWVHYYAGKHELALEQYRLTLGPDPDFELAYLWSGWALEELARVPARRSAARGT